MSTSQSKERVQPFLDTYGLDPEDFVKKPDEFTSFNDFFFRKLSAEARPINQAPDSIVFPADGRHLGFPKASDIKGVFVKGQSFDLTELLGDAELAKKYSDGTLILSRLCPVDYHRYHFPVAGIPNETQVINGPLFSVSPIALRKNLNYLWQNKRTITQVGTESLGTVICMEIGATCVGSIHQTFTAGEKIEKGAEIGYFAFGGSSTITLFEPNRVTLAEDLASHSAKQTELYAKVGTVMAMASATK